MRLRIEIASGRRLSNGLHRETTIQDFDDLIDAVNRAKDRKMIPNDPDILSDVAGIIEGLKQDFIKRFHPPGAPFPYGGKTREGF